MPTIDVCCQPNVKNNALIMDTVIMAEAVVYLMVVVVVRQAAVVVSVAVVFGVYTLLMGSVTGYSRSCHSNRSIINETKSIIDCRNNRSTYNVSKNLTKLCILIKNSRSVNEPFI